MATPAPKPETENRLPTRLLALLVILVGLGLVVYVFLTAKHLLDQPPLQLPKPATTPIPSPGATPNPTNALGEGALRGIVLPLADDVRKLLALLVMCVAGGLIAALGIRWWGKR